MAPIYQEAHAQLLLYASTPRLVVTGQAKLLPSFAYAYVTHKKGLKTKGSPLPTWSASTKRPSHASASSS